MQQAASADSEAKAPSLGRTAAMITAGRSAQLVVIFALGAMLSRSLTDHEYATYQHVNFLGAAIPMFVATPVTKTVNYFLPRRADHSPFLRRTCAFLCGIGLIAGLVFAFVPAVPALFDGKDASLVTHRGIIGALIAVAFPYAVAEGVMIARGMGALYARLMFVQAAWLFGSIAIALRFAPQGELLPWCLGGLFAAFLFQASAGIYWMLRGGGHGAHATTRSMGILTFALPVAASVGLAVAGGQLDRFIVPILFPSGPQSSIKGIYLRGAMEPPILGAIAFSMLALAAPRIAAHHVAGETTELLALWRRGCRFVALVSIPATAASIAVAPDLFALTYGEPYAQSAQIYTWYAAVLVMRCFLPNILLEAIGATVRGAWSAAAQLLFSVMFCLLLIEPFGYIGAAAAMCLSSFASNWLVGGIFARSALKCRWRDLQDWGFLTRTVAVSVVAILVARWVLTLPPIIHTEPRALAAGHLVNIVTGLVVYGVVFLAMAFPLRIVGRSDLDQLRKLVKR